MIERWIFLSSCMIVLSQYMVQATGEVPSEKV